MTTYQRSLIDGDVLLYQVCRGCEKDADFGDMHVLHSDFEEVRQVFALRIQEIGDTLGVPLGTIAFSDQENWRKSVMPSYKAHRKDVRKPIAFHRLKAWAIDNYPSSIQPRLEADDVLGLLQTDETIIVSIDKDLGTVPGWFAHIRVNHEIEVAFTTDEQARYRHMLQGLMGDRVDGYPGCPGVGIKTAEKVLDRVCQIPGSMADTEWLNAWESVVYQYEKQGCTVEDAQENFMVAKILSSPSQYTNGAVHITMPTGVTFDV
jgi:hypothetical protein